MNFKRLFDRRVRCAKCNDEVWVSDSRVVEGVIPLRGKIKARIFEKCFQKYFGVRSISFSVKLDN